jgi:hypothetical protein
MPNTKGFLMMNRISLQGLLTVALLTGALPASVMATQNAPNVIEPMCKKGKVSIFQKSTKTFRSYNGELCNIVPIANWVMKNCKDEDELFRISDCKINAKYALEHITPQQEQFLSHSQNLIINDPQDVSDLMAIAKDKGALSPKELNVWQKYKVFFPKPSPKPFLHFKQ